MRLSSKFLQATLLLIFLIVNVNASSLAKNTFIEDYKKLIQIKKHFEEKNIDPPKWENREEVLKSFQSWDTEKDSIYRGLNLIANYNNNDEIDLSLEIDTLINSVISDQRTRKVCGKSLNFYQEKNFFQLKKWKNNNIELEQIKEKYKTYSKCHPFNEISFREVYDLFTEYDEQEKWEKFITKVLLKEHLDQKKEDVIEQPNTENKDEIENVIKQPNTDNEDEIEDDIEQPNIDNKDEIEDDIKQPNTDNEDEIEDDIKQPNTDNEDEIEDDIKQPNTDNEDELEDDIKQPNTDNEDEIDVTTTTNLAIIIPVFLVTCFLVMILYRRDKTTDELRKEIEIEKKKLKKLDQEAMKGDMEKLDQEKNKSRQKIEKLKNEIDKKTIDKTKQKKGSKALRLILAILLFFFLFLWRRNRRKKFKSS